MICRCTGYPYTSSPDSAIKNQRAVDHENVNKDTCHTMLSKRYAKMSNSINMERVCPEVIKIS